MRTSPLLPYILGFLLLVTAAFHFRKQKAENYVGNLHVATPIDIKRAYKYALKKMCDAGGYTWVEQADEFTYDCKHTQDTCERDSVYPTLTDTTPKYYEWRKPETKDAQIAASRAGQLIDTSTRTLSQIAGHSSLRESSSNINNKDTGGVCIMGNEMYRKFCEDNGLTYNKQTGKCVTNKQYCNNRCLPFCNGDCFRPPKSWLVEQVIGTTVGRTLNCAANMATSAVCNIPGDEGNVAPTVASYFLSLVPGL
jgi:hypothetical protein